MWYGEDQDYYKVGKVKDAHGVKGELYLLVFSKELAWLPDLKKVLIEKENPKVESDQRSLSIQNVRPHKGGFILKTADIKDRNEAETLKGFMLYIPKELLVSESGERPYLLELKNFLVVDLNKNLLGEVVDFSSNGAQDLLVIKGKTGQFEIPYVDALVQQIDYESQTLIVDLPEGLVELYE